MITVSKITDQQDWLISGLLISLLIIGDRLAD